jgi:hypothetical protein
MRWVDHIARVMHRSGAFGILVGKSERRSLERPRCKWKYNIKMDLLEVGWGHELN